jgi:predicted double-glycine peptidase
VSSLRSIPAGAIKVDLPNVSQVTGYTCGPSALMAVCAYFGVVDDALEWEADFARAMGVGRAGADPHQLTVPARGRFGLEVQEFQPMADSELRWCLDRRRPVLMMLQAWGEGHWVAAIGYDRSGVYFEDPSLHTSRGYLKWRELAARWHDVGYRGVHVPRYGAAMWKPGARRATHRSRARRIG